MIQLFFNICYYRFFDNIFIYKVFLCVKHFILQLYMSEVMSLVNTIFVPKNVLSNDNKKYIIVELPTPKNNYVYTSKYSSLSPEEILREKKKKSAEWKKNLSEGDKEKLKLRMRELSKKQIRSGICVTCGHKHYADLYQHKRSKKHKRNADMLNKNMTV